MLWQIVVWLTDAPHYILPGPAAVAASGWDNVELIFQHAGVTIAEILLGLALGVMLGATSALLLVQFPAARHSLMPLLVASQAIPVFALAPVLVLWLGYGLWSKVAMATLIIFFPVTAAFLDGLRRADSGWLDLARSMTTTVEHPYGDARAMLRHIRLPAALPALASGIRVATATAPIGAVVGEWVGSSRGLGYLMLHANGRLQIDLMFAALLTLAIFAVLLWYGMDHLLRKMIPWQHDSLNDTGRNVA
ncbi:MAG: ABC transporter permease [Pseudomonadota bacterium]